MFVSQGDVCVVGWCLCCRVMFVLQGDVCVAG